MQFYKLAPGARFEFEGKRYVKTGIEVAEEENGNCRSISRGWEVTPIGEPLLLSEEAAEKWRPIIKAANLKAE